MRPSYIFPAYIATTSAWGEDLDYCLATSGFAAAVFQDSACPAGTILPITSDISGEDSAQTYPIWTHSLPCFRNWSEEYCVYSSSGFAGNKGISIITTPKTAKDMMQLPAFQDPRTVKGVNHDSEPQYRREMVAGKGYGLIANKFLNRGDRILSNTASTMLDYGAFEAMPEHEVERLQMAMVDNLPPQHRRRYMALSTHDEISGYAERITKVMSTNAFDVTVETEDMPFFYTVFTDIARINHDCRPNADYHFDPETLTQHVHALRPIMEGEEITLSYIDPIMTRSKRQAKLEGTWGFKCSCSLCTQPSAMESASDDRIKKIQHLRIKLGDLTEHRDGSPEELKLEAVMIRELAEAPHMAELMLSLIEQERSYTLLFEASAYAAVAWNAVGEHHLATKHASIALEMGLISAGIHDEDVADMAELSMRPQDHWSYMTSIYP